MLRVKGYFLLRSRKRVVQKIGEIDLAVASRKILAHLKQIASADHLVDRAASELCHILPQILCDKAHKILHIFRLAGKTLPKLRVLCRNTCRTGIQVTDAHHHAA